MPEEVEVITDEEKLLDWIVQNACFSADTVAIGFQGTQAQKTRVIIKRALEALIANKLIEIVFDESTWPGYYVSDPPYTSVFSKEE